MVGKITITVYSGWKISATKGLANAILLIMIRYRSINEEMKATYGRKVYRVSLDGGMTCPNRDGSIDSRGCIFCSAGGSGDFAEDRSLSITEQIEAGKRRIVSKAPNCDAFIAYFQAYTNTYAKVDYLRSIFTEAIGHPQVVVLSIATRPDCISDEVVALLKEINEIKPVWVELGLQTIHESTAAFIRRGYPLSVYDDALSRLTAAGIKVITHVILGLPGESHDDMLSTADYVCKGGAWGIKLQLLHVLKGTDLATYYEAHPFHIMSLEEYCDLLVDCLRLVPDDMVVHRITGDGPKSLLIEPTWSGDKKRVLNAITKKLREAD